jgi:alpha-tubulin suppressor-like RCC1 family protein
MSLQLKKLFLILLLLPFLAKAQTPYYMAACGEYQNPLVNLHAGTFGTGNIAGATGSGGSGGVPGLLTPAHWPGATPTIVWASSCLHNQHVVDNSGNEYSTGNNDNLSLGLGPSAGNQSSMVQLTRDSAGNTFNNVIKSFDGANSNGSYSFSIKGDGTLWGVGNLQGFRGNGSNTSANSGYPVQITGFAAGDSVIDVKAGPIIMVLTQNRTAGTRKVYTSGGNSAFTGNSTSDYLWHVLSLSFTPQAIDMGTYWSFILGTNGNLYGWGWYQQVWGGTIGSSPTVPTNIMSYINMASGSMAQFSEGAIMQYAINTSGYLYSWGDDVTSAIGINPKPHWNTYGLPPLYGSSKYPWAWDQDLTPSPLESAVTQAHKIDSCHTYIAVWAGRTYAAMMIAERSDHILVSQGRGKAGVLLNGVYDQQWANGNPEGLYPNSYDSASRNILALDMIFPSNDAGGVARHAPYCDTVPTATYCSLYTPENEAPPTITNWSNQTISTSTWAGWTPTITPASGHTVNNIRVRDITPGGCPVTTIAAPYSATTSISGLTIGTHTIQIVATDDQYKQTTTSAVITVSGTPQTVFYIAAAGTGTACTSVAPCPISYWPTLEPALVGGDIVYFNRGDSFPQDLVMAVSGSAGNPITLTAYGTGKDPIIGGMTILSGWTNVSGNVWGVPWTKPTPNLLSVNSALASKSRTPNQTTGYWIPTSGTINTWTDAAHSSLVHIGDTMINRSSGYTLDLSVVTGNASNIITESPNFSYNPSTTGGLGYFRIGDLPDSVTEWRDTAGIIQAYSVGNPSGVYKVPAVGIPLTISGNYINVTGLHIKGGDTTCILLTGSHDNINGDSITFGYDGIEMTSAVSDTITNNYMAHFGDNAILKTNTSNYNNVITNNFIYDVGMIPGMGRTGNTYQSYCGILAGDSGNIVKFNMLDSIGYIPIAIYGNRFKADTNYIINYGLVKTDVGGIYTWVGSTTTFSQREIKSNIIGNGGGPMALNGTTGLTNLVAAVYADNYSSQITAWYNSAFNIQGPSFFDHGANNDWEYNTSYGSWRDFYPAEVGPVITNLIGKHNVWASATWTQAAGGASTINSDLNLFGIIDSNQIAGYNGAPYPFWTFSTGASDPGTFRTLAGWTANTGYDAHSTYTTGVLYFVYNQTGVSVVTPLPGAFIDLNGNSYWGSITLAPYTSMVLINSGVPIQILRGSRVIIL